MNKDKTIIDFFGDGCGNCKALEPIINQLKAEHPEINFQKVNIKDAEDLVEKYGVSSLPTIVFLRGDEMIEKMTGLKPKVIITRKIAEVFG